MVEISKNAKILERMTISSRGRSCSTSYPSGNQVDGSPLVANTKTIAKPARVEPHTQIVLTMKMLFLMRKPSTSLRGIPIIVVDIVLKICIELIKSRNDNAMEKFYRLRTFSKVDIFGRNFENFPKFSEKYQFHRGTRSCSTSYLSGNQVDGSPIVAIIRKQWLSRTDLGSHKMVN